MFFGGGLKFLSFLLLILYCFIFISVLDLVILVLYYSFFCFIKEQLGHSSKYLILRSTEENNHTGF